MSFHLLQQTRSEHVQRDRSGFEQHAGSRLCTMQQSLGTMQTELALRNFCQCTNLRAC